LRPVGQTEKEEEEVSKESKQSQLTGTKRKVGGIGGQASNNKLTFGGGETEKRGGRYDPPRTPTGVLTL